MTMSRGSRIAFGIAVAVIALGAGIHIQLTRYATDTPTGVAALAQTTLPDLAGKPLTVDSWKGKVRVVNFWATWCAPCRKEIPELIAFQREHSANGIQIVGIAVDQVDKVQNYAKEMGVNYPILVAGMAGVELARQAGNPTGALPFTIALDRDGAVLGTHLGALTGEQLRKLLGLPVADAGKSG
jgi:thiol-disulfide isomerase/thioredoxin